MLKTSIKLSFQFPTQHCAITRSHSLMHSLNRRVFPVFFAVHFLFSKCSFWHSVFIKTAFNHASGGEFDQEIFEWQIENQNSYMISSLLLKRSICSAKSFMLDSVQGVGWADPHQHDHLDQHSGRWRPSSTGSSAPCASPTSSSSSATCSSLLAPLR